MSGKNSFFGDDDRRKENMSKKIAPVRLEDEPEDWQEEDVFYEEEPEPKKKRIKKPKLPGSLNKKATDRQPKRVLAWRMTKPLVAIAIAVAIVGLCLYFVFNYVQGHYFAPVDANSSQQIEVVIERGSSLTEISETLEKNGIIRNSSVFKYYVDFSDNSSKLMAGTYMLSPSMTFDDIIETLKRPTDTREEIRITFPEGMTVEDMANKLVDEGILKNTTTFLEIVRTGKGYEDSYFIEAVADKEKDADKKRKYLMEGYLFPDTYDFFTDSSEEMIIDKLTDKFDSIMTDAYMERAQELDMSVDDVIILASIIEKEAKVDDFAKVSAVFHNRLKEGTTLGSCATQQYFMEERKLVWNNEELAIDSPYNTYKYPGLPVGPICNPSEAAIKAALYPNEEYLEEGYFYFCLGDPATGELFFSKTLEEHNVYKAQYEEQWLAYQNANQTEDNG